MFRGVHTLIFPYVPYIVTGLVHEEPANFYREKRRVAFVTGHLFTCVVVLSLICLVATQTHTPEKRTLSAQWPLPILPPAHTTFFPILIKERTSFLITQPPKNKREFILKVLQIHINRINCTYIQQVQEIDTNLSHSMNELAPRALWFHSSWSSTMACG